MTEDKYYDVMSNMSRFKTFEEIHENWFNCFDYILRSWKCSFNKKSIKKLFYDFNMQNWALLHRENSYCRNFTKEELFEEFCKECDYVSDRCDFDRLFRTHWLFLEAFRDEMNKIKYPRVFS